MLLGKITYGKVSLGDSKGEQTRKACPASSNIFYIVPPPAKVGRIVVNCGWKQNLIFYMQNLSYSIPVLSVCVCLVIQQSIVLDPSFVILHSWDFLDEYHVGYDILLVCYISQNPFIMLMISVYLNFYQVEEKDREQGSSSSSKRNFK